MFGSASINQNHYCGSATPMSDKEIAAWNAALDKAAAIAYENGDGLTAGMIEEQKK